MCMFLLACVENTCVCYTDDVYLRVCVAAGDFAEAEGLLRRVLRYHESQASKATGGWGPEAAGAALALSRILRRARRQDLEAVDLGR
jgi:hypothetical protein